MIHSVRPLPITGMAPNSASALLAAGIALILSRAKRRLVSITARTTYAFTRDMTLEVYMQPFVAAGDYSNIRRLALPRSFQFDPVTIATNPDFNTKSLRGNVVMRWEYKPGSTLFLVWDLSQADLSRPGHVVPLLRRELA